MRKLALVLGTALFTISTMASAANYRDRQGNDWLRLDDPIVKANLSSVATHCQQDPCTGPLAGLTWASSDEVLELMREFDPNLPTGGQDQFFAASNFSAALGITYMFNTTYSMSEGSVGRTSSKDASGQDIYGFSSYGHNMVSVSGSLGVGPMSATNAATLRASAFLFLKPGRNLPPKNCTFLGNTVLHGASVLAYLSSSVAYGSTCKSESRVCDNGALSGTYTYASCTVQAAPVVVTPPPTNSCSSIKDSKLRKRCLNKLKSSND